MTTRAQTRPSSDRSVFNLERPTWDDVRERDGFIVRLTSVGARLGSELLGATLWELLPGQRTLFHCHHANEELLLVVLGSPVVRTNGRTFGLKRGDIMMFPRGRSGSHALSNPHAAAVRFLFVSTRIEPDIVEFPDSGKLGVFAGAPPTMGAEAPLEVFLPLAAAVGYYEGES